MSDPTPSDTGLSDTATAVAAPPAPPARTPTSTTGAPGPDRKRKHTGAIVAIVLSVIAIALIGVGVWLVVSAKSNSANASRMSAAATQSAFASAMKKAGVTAAYPTSAPVELTTVKSTGSHPFSATFTPDELAALISTFSYTADVAGMQIAIPSATVRFPSPGVASLDARVKANGGDYSGSVTIPVAYANGSVTSGGATDLTVEGIPANSAQKAQVTDALVLYANSVLHAAPGLAVDSAAITADGLSVTGSAPDSITYP